MSGYAAGEAAILALVQTVSGFYTSNTAQSKWKLLNTNNGPKYVILRPGRFTSSRPTMGAKEYTWTTVIQVWERFKNDGTTITALITDVANITAVLDSYRFLGLGPDDTILRSRILEGSDLQEMWTKGGGPQWIKQDITVEWTEIVPITYAE